MVVSIVIVGIARGLAVHGVLLVALFVVRVGVIHQIVDARANFHDVTFVGHDGSGYLVATPGARFLGGQTAVLVAMSNVCTTYEHDLRKSTEVQMN